MTFRILHFEVLTFLKCKIFFIGFLDDFKQKNFYISKCKIFYILQQRTRRVFNSLSLERRSSCLLKTYIQYSQTPT